MDNPKEPAQPFERYPALASWIERMANSAMDLSLGDWMVFVGALNHAILTAEGRASPAPGPIGEEPPGSGWVPTQPQRFVVGQPVEIATTYRYHADWHGQHLWIAGVQRFDRDKELNYAITEYWPPRHPGDITDGFTEADLSPLPTPPAKAE